MNELSEHYGESLLYRTVSLSLAPLHLDGAAMQPLGHLPLHFSK